MFVADYRLYTAFRSCCDCSLHWNYFLAIGKQSYGSSIPDLRHFPSNHLARFSNDASRAPIRHVSPHLRSRE